jgi:hypothetical protein
LVYFHTLQSINSRSKNGLSLSWNAHLFPINTSVLQTHLIRGSILCHTSLLRSTVCHCHGGNTSPVSFSKRDSGSRRGTPRGRSEAGSSGIGTPYPKLGNRKGQVFTSHASGLDRAPLRQGGYRFPISKSQGQVFP